MIGEHRLNHQNFSCVSEGKKDDGIEQRKASSNIGWAVCLSRVS